MRGPSMGVKSSFLMLARGLVTAALVVGVLPPVAHAELTIEIREGVKDPVPIAIVPFGWQSVGTPPYDVAQVVESDLHRSGLFTPMARGDMIDRPTRSEDVKLEDWRMLRNDFLVVGQIVPEQDGRFTILFELI